MSQASPVATNSKHICRLLAVIEAELPVNAYRVGVDPLWPIVRGLLGWFLVGGDPELNGGGRWYSPFLDQRYAEIAPGFPQAAAAMAAYYPAPGVEARPGTMFAGVLAIHHNAHTEAGCFHPVIDPWIRMAEPRHRVIKVEFLDEHSLDLQPRACPTLMTPSDARFVAGKAEAAAIAALVADLLAWFDARGIWRHPDLGRYLVGQSLMVAAWRETWGRILDQSRPDAVFVSCWYAMHMMALIWAARARGIPSVDSQHGMVTESHVAYSHWTVVPDEGYAQVPDWFLAWGEPSAASIGRWFPDLGRSGQHRVRIAGRQYVPLDLLGDAAKRSHAVLERMRAIAAKVVLYSASTVPGSGAPEILIAAMRAAPPDWLWLLRGHPLAEREGASDTTLGAIAARLDAEGISNYECQAATALPLDVVLGASDHHVTWSSSTVLEALALGIPSTCFHETGLDYYADAIAQGKIGYAASANDLVRAIAAGRDGLPGFPKADGGREVIVNAALSRAALAEVMAEACGAESAAHS